MEEMQQEDPLEVEISDLETGEPSPAERYLKHVGEWFQRRVRRPSLLWAGSTMALVIMLMLLVLRSVMPVLGPSRPARVNVSPSMNLFSVAVESIPGETLVVSPDGVVSALRLGTGAAIWHFMEASGVWGTPIVLQGIIFVNTNDGRAIALQGTTGKVIWTHSEASFSTSVLQAGHGIVFVRVQAARTFGGRVVALRASDGFPLWQQLTLHFHRFVAEESADRAYISDGAGRVAAVRIRDGRLLWTEHTRMRSWMDVEDGLVSVATQDGDIAGLRADTGAQLWHTRLRLGALDVPLIGAGNIFVPTTDGGMSVLDATTGSLRWNAEAEPLVIVGGLVYSLTEDSRMVVLRASTGTPLKWYRNIESAQPSGGQGKIFAVTSNGDLIVLQANTGALLWRWQAPSPILSLRPGGALVYVSTRSNGILVLRAKDGSVLCNIGAAAQR